MSYPSGGGAGHPAPSAALAGCVTSLQSSIRLLGSSISILDTGVNDYERLSRVLQTTRHFHLVPEPTLRSAQSALGSALEPQVHSLLERVDAHLERLARREQALVAKAELQAGRIEGATGGSSAAAKRRAAAAAAGGGAGRARSGSNRSREDEPVAGKEGVEDTMAELRMRQLRHKKERLSFQVEGLKLKARQRERELRMSMAAQ